MKSSLPSQRRILGVRVKYGRRKTEPLTRDAAFNPTPFLQTFSPALDTLLELRKHVTERTKKMETDVRRAEREYGKRLRELDGGFEVCAYSGDGDVRARLT